MEGVSRKGGERGKEEFVHTSEWVDNEIGEEETKSMETRFLKKYAGVMAEFNGDELGLKEFFSLLEEKVWDV